MKSQIIFSWTWTHKKKHQEAQITRWWNINTRIRAKTAETLQAKDMMETTDGILDGGS